MRRRLFTLGSAVSLVLCVAASTLLAFSYFRSVAVDWGGWAPVVSPPVARADEATLREESGYVLAGRGSLRWFRRRQVITVPPFAAADLLAADPARRPGFAIGSLGEGNEYGPPRDRPGIAARFGFYTSARPGRVPTTRIDEGACPIWAAALAMAVAPATSLTARLRLRRRLAFGRCPACGYDLRVTPARCPECGRLTPGTAAA